MVIEALKKITLSQNSQNVHKLNIYIPNIWMLYRLYLWWDEHVFLCSKYEILFGQVGLLR